MPVSLSVPAPPDVAERRASARRARYDAQRVVWRETRLRRLAYCGRMVSDKSNGVTVKVTKTEGGNVAGFSGLQLCGSVWACPVCSEKINAGRQAELTAGCSAWLDQGHGIIFGTVTLSHHKGQALAELWDAITPAFNRMTSGAGVAWNGGKNELGDKARFGIRGVVRVVEVTHGVNGWHPHVHFLLFTDEPLELAQVDELQRRMFGRWAGALGKAGLRATFEHGIDLRRVGKEDGSGLADYFTKGTYSAPAAAAYEVTGSHSKKQSKGGRSPFKILADLVQHGDADDLDLWHEWEAASKGRRQLNWSRGLRAMLALAVEQTDQELAEADDLDGDALWTFTSEEWVRGRWAMRRVELLEHAEAGTLPRFISEATPGILDRPPDVRET